MAPINSDQVVVVTGASRGLGLEHVKQFLEKTQSKVVGTARSPAKADQLKALVQQYSGRLHVVALDTSDEDSIKAAAEEVSKLFPEGFDVLLNNAGTQEGTQRALETTGQAYTDVLVTNVVGPFLTTKHFLPLLKKKQTRKIVNTSSILGSVSWNRSGMKGENPFGPYFVAYNSAKAALNMQTSILANDLKDEGFTVIALHPGWVKTDMGNAAKDLPEAGEGPPLDAETSIAEQHKVIYSVTAKDSGKFIGYDGNELQY